MAIGSEKPNPPKTKSNLKPHKSVEHKRKNRNPNVNTRADEKKGKGKGQVSTKEGTNGGSGSEATLISAGPSERQLRFFLHRYETATKSKLSPLELEAYRGASISIF
jgi:hypothetical protein